ncbi:MAG: STAS/SEC14 domain-containing protein [Candidatus Nanopelagicales bacterium]
MIEKLARSDGRTLGFALSGAVDRDDYDVLVPAVTEVVAAYGSVNLLCDLRQFRWEKADAWGSDLRFGRDFKHSTTRMAVVGDGAFSHLLATLSQPFYAEQVEYFTDLDEAWAWVEQG